MEQARHFAEQLMSNRGGEEPTPAVEGTEKGPGEAGVGSTVAGLARQYLSSEEPGHEAGTGDKQAGGSLGAMAMGAAQTWLGGGGGGGAVRGETAEGGAGQADVGLVDELLGLYQQTQGKSFGGQEHEYDKLAGLANSALGTPIGRDLLKAWVKSRLGL